ncbi:MAG: hypothetical protein AB1643_00990 [Patescibacteria group bacterium]
MYPQSYRDLLSHWQDMLVDEKSIKTESRVSFQNQEEIFEFAQKAIIYLKDHNMIPQEDADRFLATGLAEWKKINEIEAANYRSGLLPLSIKQSPHFVSSSCRGNNQTQSSSNLFDLIKKIVFGEKTEAQICAKPGAGIGPIPGVNLWAPCCACFCGKAPCGCLNAVCACCNAIWDPMTGICGCDI